MPTRLHKYMLSQTWCLADKCWFEKGLVGKNQYLGILHRISNEELQHQ